MNSYINCDGMELAWWSVSLEVFHIQLTPPKCSTDFPPGTIKSPHRE